MPETQEDRDLAVLGGWTHRPGIPVVEPLDYVFQVPTAAGAAPVELHLVFTDDGLYVPAAVRRPPGHGPYPAVLTMHGGSGGLGISFLVDQMIHRGYVLDRLVEEGYVVVYTEGRMEIEWAYGMDIEAALDHQDLIRTFRHVQQLPYVAPARVGFFGVSHGGELQMKLITELTTRPKRHASDHLPLPAALVPGEPAVIEYLGLKFDGPRTEAGLQFNAPIGDDQIDFERAWQRIQAVPDGLPILVLGRDRDHLQGPFHKLYELLERAGKDVRWRSWDHDFHAYQWGPGRSERPIETPGTSTGLVETSYQPDPIQRETLDAVVAFLNQHVRDRVKEMA